jgi:hypothetical protein
MLAHLENKRIEAATEYARRGRLLELVPDEDLSRDWLLASRARAATARDGQKYDYRPLPDIEAEMYLRGYDPPLDLAHEEIKILRDASERRRDQLERDPKRHTKFEQKVSKDFAAFAQSFDDPKSN